MAIHHGGGVDFDHGTVRVDVHDREVGQDLGDALAVLLQLATLVARHVHPLEGTLELEVDRPLLTLVQAGVAVHLDVENVQVEAVPLRGEGDGDALRVAVPVSSLTDPRGTNQSERHSTLFSG